MMTTKVLIAGATGLIGTKLATHLIELGHQVHFLTRNKSQLGPGPLGVGFYWNPAQGEIDSAALAGVQKIVNLAGAPVAKPWTKQHKVRILESRKQAAQVLYRALSTNDHQISHYVSASGIAAYASDPQAWYTEAAATDSSSFLGQVVQQWETAADLFKDLGLGVAKLRIGLVLATDGGAFPALAKPVKMGVGACLGSGEQWQSWIHIDDLVEQLYFILDNDLSGIYNGVGPNPVTQQRFLSLLAQKYGQKLWLPSVPAWVLRLAMGQRADIVLDSQRVSSQKFQDLGFEFKFYNLDAALDSLLTKQ